MFLIIRRLFAVLTPKERRHGLLLLMMMFGVAIFETAGVASIMPFLAVLGNPEMVETNAILGWLYERGGFDSADSFIWFLGIGAFIMVMASGFFRLLSTYASSRYIQMRRHGLSTRLLQTYLRQPYEFFLDRNSANLSTSILSEVDVLSSKMISPVLKLFSYGLVSVILIMLLILVEPWLATLALVIIGALYFASYCGVRGLLQRLGSRRLATNRDRYRTASEAFGGIKDLKVLGREGAYLRRFGRPSELYARYKTTATTISAAPRYLIEAMGFGGILALALWLMTTRDDLGEVLPLLGLFTFAAYRILPAAQQIYSSASDLRFGLAALDTVYDDLMVLTSDVTVKGEGDSRLVLTEGIEFQGVDFYYPGTAKPALDSLDLTISAHTSVAFVGKTGAGKTTAVDLILGLLQPTNGRIFIDGEPLTRDNMRRWQRSIGYVPQTIYLADASVAENIAFGLHPGKVDRQAVERAARIANIHDFISRQLPSGYSTKVGERGIRLSGGQRQRIGIARALYHDPALLVLDEATSALDTPTERAIMESVERLSGEKTIVMIAHRISTVKQCDQIIVLDNGRLKGLGRFDDLKASNEVFQRLAVA